MKNDILISNNTVYQDILREGRRKSLPVAGRRIIAELEQEIQHLDEEKVMEMLSLKYENQKQQEELKRLQQKGKPHY